MKVYLAHFTCNLYQDSKQIGLAEYDARKGGANMGKFGPPETKIKPVIDQMFGKAQPQ